jgi:hypothetical protein
VCDVDGPALSSIVRTETKLVIVQSQHGEATSAHHSPPSQTVVTLKPSSCRNFQIQSANRKWTDVLQSFVCARVAAICATFVCAYIDFSLHRSIESIKSN